MLKQIGYLSLTYLLGATVGYGFSLIHFPLPWMIGSAIAVAIAVSLGWPGRAPKMTRSWGQIIVAASIGLTMTPAALDSVAEHILLMIAAAVVTILAGLAVAGLFMRLTKVDAITACLACVPLGPMEGMRLAEQYKVNAPAVAFAQAIRIITLVVIIPPALLFFSGWRPLPQLGAEIGEHTLAGAVLLLLGSAICGGAAAKMRIPNGAFLGALGFSTLAAILSLPVQPLPTIVLIVGQLLLGVSLGSMFDRTLANRLHVFAIASFTATLGLLAFCALGAEIAAVITGLPWQTLVLATAPGSLTEMSLTAKLMHFDAPLVTAFHILRISLILLITPAIFGIVRWVSNRLE